MKTDHETQYCMVTHPNMPNHDGHARGRAVHIVKGDNKSVCNMLIDKIYRTDHEIWLALNRKKCKICFKDIEL